MEINALLMHARDNIVVCVKDVARGSEVIFQKDGKICTLTAQNDIPACHKVAIVPIAQDAPVLKYGERIGLMNCAVEVGQLVDHNNIRCIPRDYESEMVEETGKQLSTEAESFYLS